MQGTQNGWVIVKKFVTKHGSTKKEIAIHSSIMPGETRNGMKGQGMTLEDGAHRLEGIQQATEGRAGKRNY